MNLWNIPVNQLPQGGIQRTVIGENTRSQLLAGTIRTKMTMEEDNTSVNQANQHLLNIGTKLTGFAAATAAASIIQEV